MRPVDQSADLVGDRLEICQFAGPEGIGQGAGYVERPQYPLVEKNGNVDLRSHARFR
jgi:hypothetical protein